MAAFFASAQDNLRQESPQVCGMDGKKLERVDSVINEAITDGTIPGAVVSVVRGDKIAYLKAYGNKSLVPEVEPMSVETVFDL
ncbi:MAG: esterase, partial [Bacteroidales bacterium]|nr:esterase [Bacteroidales bacterium]